jgi:putative redox protein
MSSEAQVTWLEDRRFVGQASSGHAIVVDASSHKLGSSPMELVLIGLLGCTAYDVVEILHRQRQHITGLTVRGWAERAEEPPRVYTSIDLEYVVRGRDVKVKAVENAIRLSKEKYCSASAMLERTAEIRTAYRIEQDEG